MRNLRRLSLGVLFLSVIWMSGCSEEEISPTGSLNVNFKSSINSLKNVSNGRVTAGDVVISDFKLSFKDIVLKYDNSGQGSTDSTTNILFEGPYVVDLLDDGDALQQSLGEVTLLNGTYKTLRFVFHKSEDMTTDHQLYDRSIFIAGTIKGIPFEMWHDTSENFDILENTGFTISGNRLDITVDFNIDHFVDAIHTIDLTTAGDENQDGKIEINTNDPDGNKELADLMKENIKASAIIVK